MLFNSIDFAIFLPIVFILYWFVTNKNLKLQNFLIVAASYLFYGWWDWRFLSLILFSTVVDYTIGRKLRMEENQTKRKILLWTSILVNLGFLGFFKYYNFFLDNFITAFSFFGTEIKANSLNIILPVGISFYTFQTLSYTIDVYKRKLEPTKDFIAFSAFVSFFPQLVAGPIERATNLFQQLERRERERARRLEEQERRLAEKEGEFTQRQLRVHAAMRQWRDELDKQSQQAGRRSQQPRAGTARSRARSCPVPMIDEEVAA